jgi:enediyne biosynthesis protein E4
MNFRLSMLWPKKRARALLLGLAGAAALSFGQIHFTEVSARFGVRGSPDFGGEGVSWVDVNRDGRMDIFVKNQGTKSSPSAPDILYINYGDYFIDEAGSRGVANAYPYGTHGAVFVDLDGDQDFDLMASTVYGGISPAFNHLYRNNGNGYFEDMTSSIVPAQTVDLTTSGVAAADFDGDGDIDLYFSNPLPVLDPFKALPSPPQKLPNFYINNGDGTFTPEYRGIDWTGFTQGVTTGDYDGDGDIDIAQAMYGPASTIFRNDGTGHFQNVGAEIGLPTGYGEFDNGITWADLDNDGDLDLAIVGKGRIDLYRNSGGSYSDYQVIRWTRPIEGYMVSFGDFDNDGDLDLYLSGENVYENDGQGNFTLIPPEESGLGASLSIAEPRGCALADFDGDGDLDIYVTNETGSNRLFRNDLNNSAWIKAEVKIDTRGRVGGIGAKFDLYDAGKVGVAAALRGHREMRGESGYLGQDAPVAHFGAPEAGGARYDLRVTFPDGTQRVYSGLSPGQTVEVASVSPPLNVRFEKIENKALFFRETLIELTWEPNPLNDDVARYRVYELDQGQILLAELSASDFVYTLRNVDKSRAYRFAVTAVDSLGVESEPASSDGSTGALLDRTRRRGQNQTLKGKS